MMYPENLAGVSAISKMYPANFPGLGRGLDFLLLLFLHQGKKRRIEEAKRITFQSSY